MQKQQWRVVCVTRLFCWWTLVGGFLWVVLRVSSFCVLHWGVSWTFGSFWILLMFCWKIFDLVETFQKRVDVFPKGNVKIETNICDFLRKLSGAFPNGWNIQAHRNRGCVGGAWKRAWKLMSTSLQRMFVFYLVKLVINCILGLRLSWTFIHAYNDTIDPQILLLKLLQVVNHQRTPFP